MADTPDNEFSNMNSSYVCFPNKLNSENVLPKTVKVRKYQIHVKTYSPKWELDPNYRGWVQRSRRGDGFFYCLACNKDYTCGKSELDKHASSKKHCLNLKTMTCVSVPPSEALITAKTDDRDTSESMFFNDLNSSTSFVMDDESSESKEESFGKYIISELKRIKKKKTYELVKWEILQTLQKAMLKEVETEDSED